MCHNYHSYALTVLNRVSACFFEQIGTRLQRVGYSGPSVEGHWWEVWDGDQARVNPFQAIGGWNGKDWHVPETKETNIWRRKSLRDIWNDHKNDHGMVVLRILLFGETHYFPEWESIKSKVGGVWLVIAMTDNGGFTLWVTCDQHTPYETDILEKNFRKLHTMLAYIPKAYKIAEKWHNTPKKVVLQKRKAA